MKRRSFSIIFLKFHLQMFWLIKKISLVFRALSNKFALKGFNFSILLIIALMFDEMLHWRKIKIAVITKMVSYSIMNLQMSMKIGFLAKLLIARSAREGLFLGMNQFMLCELRFEQKWFLALIAPNYQEPTILFLFHLFQLILQLKIVKM